MAWYNDTERHSITSYGAFSSRNVNISTKISAKTIPIDTPSNVSPSRNLSFKEFVNIFKKAKINLKRLRGFNAVKIVIKKPNGKEIIGEGFEVSDNANDYLVLVFKNEKDKEKFMLEYFLSHFTNQFRSPDVKAKFVFHHVREIFKHPRSLIPKYWKSKYFNPEFIDYMDSNLNKTLSLTDLAFINKYIRMNEVVARNHGDNQLADKLEKLRKEIVNLMEERGYPTTPLGGLVRRDTGMAKTLKKEIRFKPITTDDLATLTDKILGTATSDTVKKIKETVSFSKSAMRMRKTKFSEKNEILDRLILSYLDAKMVAILPASYDENVGFSNEEIEKLLSGYFLPSEKLKDKAVIFYHIPEEKTTGALFVVDKDKLNKLMKYELVNPEFFMNKKELFVNDKTEFLNRAKEVVQKKRYIMEYEPFKGAIPSKRKVQPNIAVFKIERYRPPFAHITYD